MIKNLLLVKKYSANILNKKRAPEGSLNNNYELSIELNIRLL